MANCDGFFENLGIGFTPPEQDTAVRAVLSADFHDPPYKKFLILCWFDTTYGKWTGPRVDTRLSRQNASEWLTENGWQNYEDAIAQAIQTKQ